MESPLTLLVESHLNGNDRKEEKFITEFKSESSYIFDPVQTLEDPGNKGAVGGSKVKECTKETKTCKVEDVPMPDYVFKCPFVPCPAFTIEQVSNKGDLRVENRKE